MRRERNLQSLARFTTVAFREVCGEIGVRAQSPGCCALREGPLSFRPDKAQGDKWLLRVR